MDTKGIFKKTVNILTLASFLLWNLAAATPEGGAVVQGNATISQSGAQTTVNQTSQAAVINWNSFNTASHEAVQFNQPNSSAVALNRITNGLPTQFAGQLNANGQVWILNPAGVLFTSTAQIDVAGLVATTHGITDSNFMAGNYAFDLIPGSESSSIINNGLISAKDSGIVALVAPHVANNGLIQANLGKVSLSSGAAYTLDMYGDSLINFGSNAPIQNGSVSNAGTVIANGGKVYMTANYAAGVLDNMISMSGTIEAKSVGVNHKGEIVLYASDAQKKKLAGVTKVTGKLDASDGGFIETSGQILEIAPTAVIKTGPGGMWLLDPDNLFVANTCANPGPGCTPTNFTAQPGDTIVDAAFIDATLAGGTSVFLTASGTISVLAPLSAVINSFVQFNINAGTGIVVDAPITLNTGTNYLTLTLFTSAGVISINPSAAAGFSIVASNGVYVYGNVVLGGDALVSGTAVGAMRFFGTIDGTTGTENLTTIGNDVRYDGDIGAVTPLGSLSTTALASNIYLNASQIITTNGQSYNGPTFTLVEQPTLLLRSVNFANIVLNNVVFANYTLPVHADLMIDGNLVSNSTLAQGVTSGLTDYGYFNSITVTGTSTFNGSSQQQYVRTDNDQTYYGAVTLAGGTLGAFISDNGNITFKSTIDGNVDVTINAAGAVSFEGNVGATNPLNNLAVSASLININTSSITTDATQTYSGPVVLLTNTTLTSNNGDITFNSTIDGPAALSVTTPGNITFYDVIGNGTPLSYLDTTSGSGLLTFTSFILNDFTPLFVITTGNQTYAGSIDLMLSNSPSMTFQGNQIEIKNLLISGYNTDVTIDGNLLMDLGSNIGGGGATPWSINIRSLTVTGSSILGGEIRTSSGDEIFMGPVQLNGSTVFNTQTGGNIIFESTIEGPGSAYIATAPFTNGSIIFNDTIGFLTPLASLAAFAVNNVVIANSSGTTSISTSGNIDIQAASGGSLPTGGILLDTLNSITFNALSVNFAGPMDSYSATSPLPTDIVINGNLFYIQGVYNTPGTGIGQNYNLPNYTSINSLDVKGTSQVGANVNSNPQDVNIRTLNDQTYEQGVTLGGTNQNFTSVNGNITFQSTFDGNSDTQSFTAVAAGVVEFDGAVGSPSLYLNNLNVTGSQININTSSIQTDGYQIYTGPVVLSIDTVLTSNSSDITFNGNITENVGPFDLSATALLGTVRFNGNVTIGSLHILGATTNTFVNDSHEIHTVGDQVYEGPVVLHSLPDFLPPPLSMALYLQSDAGNIIFNSTVDSDTNIAGHTVISAGGSVTLHDNVGQNTPFDFLIINSPVINFNGSTVNTLTYQIYNGDVIFSQPVVTLTNSDNSVGYQTNGIYLNQNVSGINTDLILSGNNYFHAVTGPYVTVNLNSLSTNSGFTDLNGTLILNTTLGQTYNGQVILEDSGYINPFLASQIQLNGSVITFNNGPVVQNPNTSVIGLVITGNMITNVEMGPSSIPGGLLFAGQDGAIGSLIVNGQSDINGGLIRSIGYQGYNGPVLLGATTLLQATDPSSLIEVFGSINNAYDLTVTSANARFWSDVGAATPLNSLTVNADIIEFVPATWSGSVATITTTGAQEYNGAFVFLVGLDPVFTASNFIFNIPVNIWADTTFTSTSGDIDFQNTLDSTFASNIVLNPASGFSAIFQGDVGASSPLATLTINGLSSINGATVIYTNGDQLYNDTMSLNNNLYIESLVDGRVQFGDQNTLTGGVSGPAFDLTVVTHNLAYGPTGAGITGMVDVANFTVGGEGGANLSFNYPASESFVSTQGAGQAVMNTIISPDFRTSGVLYCVNNFCSLVPPIPPDNNPPFNIPPVEIIPPITGVVSCDASGCNNLVVMLDNLVEAGVVTCSSIAGCPFGFVQAQDTNGVVRILIPGDVVYAGDKILKEKDSCVCIKSLYNDKKMCAGPQERDLTYYK